MRNGQLACWFLAVVLAGSLWCHGCTNMSEIDGMQEDSVGDALKDANAEHGMDQARDLTTSMDVTGKDPGILDTHSSKDIRNDNINKEGAGDQGPDEEWDCPSSFGCPCGGNEDCYSGLCIEAQDRYRCSRTCKTRDACPQGWSCGLVDGSGPDIRFVCIDPFSRLCQPCREDSECIPAIGAGNLRHICLPFGPSGRFCGVECSADTDCPDDYKCAQAPDTFPATRQCIPRSGVCECTDRFRIQENLTICSLSNIHGTCKAQRTCDQPCPASTPAPEQCNGVDDDCNGKTDDGLDGGHCDLDNAYGTCEGKTRCVAGHEFCEGASATPEICNGIDDDCDGKTDEIDATGCRTYYLDSDLDGFGAYGSGQCMCQPAVPFVATVDGDCTDRLAAVHPGAVESCNGLDDDCDGLIDEDTTNACSPYVCAPSLGRCKTTCDGPQDCQPGSECVNKVCQRACVFDPDCQAGFLCVGGRCVHDMGLECSADVECASGFCTDGVCCRQRCGSTCESCNLPGRAGFCDPVPDGQDPASECPWEPAASCRFTGACSGSRSCRMHPNGTACTTAACNSTTVSSNPDFCNGTGTCVDGGARDCTPFACNISTGRCGTSCLTSQDCAPGSVCQASTGMCLKPDGQTCATSADCFAGTCCNGLCRDLTTDRNNCGSCGTVCRNEHGSTSCSAGLCRPTCTSGWGDCDGHRSTGCETSLRTTSDCGACNTACAINDGVASCATGTCLLEGCSPEHANCDGNDSNGCEADLARTSNTCATADSVGFQCGDEACGTFCPPSTWRSFAMRTGRAGRWFKGGVLECSDCCSDVLARVTLTVPDGVDYDLYVYSSCGSLMASSTRGAGATEQVAVRRQDDCLNGNSGFDFLVEVRYHSGESCESWTLGFDGTSCS